MVPRGRWLCFSLILGGLCFPVGAWGGPSSHIHTPESLMSPPSPQAASPSETVAETQWVPLREIIQQYSETTGNQVRIKDNETFDQLYSVNDPSWLEDFSRIEILNEQTGKKEIILLGRADGQPLSGPSLNTRTPRNQHQSKVSRSKTPGVSGQAGPKYRRKNKYRNPFGHSQNRKISSPLKKQQP